MLFIWLPVSVIRIPLAASNAGLRSLWPVPAVKAVDLSGLSSCELFLVLPT
jgi:hypothetical protein